MQNVIAFKPKPERLIWYFVFPLIVMIVFAYWIFIHLGLSGAIEWASEYHMIPRLALYCGAFSGLVFFPLGMTIPAVMVYIEGHVLLIDTDKGLVKTHRFTFRKEDIVRIYMSHFWISRVAFELKDGKRRVIVSDLISTDFEQLRNEIEVALDLDRQA